MKDNTRKPLAFILALIMVLTIGPASALAQTEQPGAVEQPVESPDGAQDTCEGGRVADSTENNTVEGENIVQSPPAQSGPGNDEAAGGPAPEGEAQQQEIAVQPQPIEEGAGNSITSFDAYGDKITVSYGTAPEDISFSTLGANKGELALSGVSWSCGVYDECTPGEYVFTSVLPDGYTLAETVSLPVVTVTVENLPQTFFHVFADVLIMPFAAGDVALTEDNFDRMMIGALTPYDTDDDRILSAAEIAGITSLVVGTNDMPKGLEHLTALQSLTINLDPLVGTDFAGYSGPASCLEGFGQTGLAGTPLTYDTATGQVTGTDKGYTQHSFEYNGVAVTIALSYSIQPGYYFYPDSIQDLPHEGSATLAIDLGGYARVDFLYNNEFVILMSGTQANMTSITQSTHITVYGNRPTQGVAEADYGAQDAIVVRMTFSGNGLPEQTHGLLVRVTGDVDREYTITMDNPAAKSSHQTAKAGTRVTVTASSLDRMFDGWEIVRTGNPTLPANARFVDGSKGYKATFVMPGCDVTVGELMKIVQQDPQEPGLPQDVIDKLRNQDNNSIVQDTDQNSIQITVEFAEDEMQKTWETLWTDFINRPEWQGNWRRFIEYIEETHGSGAEVVLSPEEKALWIVLTPVEIVYSISYWIVYGVDYIIHASALPQGPLDVMLLSAAGDDFAQTAALELDQDFVERALAALTNDPLATLAAGIRFYPELMPIAAFPELFTPAGGGTTVAQAGEEAADDASSLGLPPSFDGLDTKDENGLYGGMFATEEETIEYINNVKDSYIALVELTVELYQAPATGSQVANTLLAVGGVEGGTDEENWAALTALGITDGIQDAQAPLTHEALCLMLYRAAGSPDVDMDDTDGALPDSISEDARDAVAWCMQNNEIEGELLESFQPDGEVASIDAFGYLANFLSALDPEWMDNMVDSESFTVAADIPALEGMPDVKSADASSNMPTSAVEMGFTMDNDGYKPPAPQTLQDCA